MAAFLLTNEESYLGKYMCQAIRSPLLTTELEYKGHHPSARTKPSILVALNYNRVEAKGSGLFNVINSNLLIFTTYCEGCGLNPSADKILFVSVFPLPP